MGTLLIMGLVLLGMIVVPWLSKRFPEPRTDKRLVPEQQQALPQIKRRKRRVRREELENEFPDYHPNYDDEVEWRSLVEAKFRKHIGYPPDWERRRVLVFLRDGGRCQGKDHRSGTCGRLLCDKNQIWNFKYNVKLLVDAHVDHVDSIASGGDHGLENLQLLCPKCHALKHGDWDLAAKGGLRIPQGPGRAKYLRKYFYTRKAPKPPDNDVPF